MDVGEEPRPARGNAQMGVSNRRDGMWRGGPAGGD